MADFNPAMPEVEAGIIEGDYKSWTLKWVKDHPFNSVGTATSFFIDDKNEVIVLAGNDAASDYRLGIYNISDLSVVFEAPSGRDYLRKQPYLYNLMFPKLGIVSVEGGGISRSLLSYILVGRRDSETIEVWRGGARLWTHSIKEDSPGAGWYGGMEISSTGKWVLLGDSANKKLILYEGQATGPIFNQPYPVSFYAGDYPTYAEARDLAVADDWYDLYIGQYEDTGLYSVERAVVIFDTKSLAGETITSAKLKFKVYSKDDFQNDDAIVIQSGMPDYPHNPPVLGDYNRVPYSGDGGSISGADIVIGWNEIELNETGLSWINTSGRTKFMLRAKKDIDGNPPGVGLYEEIYIDVPSNLQLLCELE